MRRAVDVHADGGVGEEPGGLPQRTVVEVEGEAGADENVGRPARGR